MRVKVKVKTNCGKSKIIKKEKDVYFVELKAKPEKGEANLELIKLFRREFKKHVRIAKGFTSKEKVLLVSEGED